MSIQLQKTKWSPWITVSKTVIFFRTICFRPEAVYDVISGRNVKTIEGILVVNFEVASSNSFRDIAKKIISWWRRRTSSIPLSENTFAFHFKIGVSWDALWGRKLVPVTWPVKLQFHMACIFPSKFQYSTIHPQRVFSTVSSCCYVSR